MTFAPGLAALLLAAAALPVAQAAEPLAASDGAAFAPTEDGQAVLDARARTLWARCVEGMQWNGKTCAGTPLLLTRAEASARAKARGAAEGVPWRLPRTLELRRLVDKQATPPGIDARLFPAAPGGLHWSGTATVRQLSLNPYNYNNIASGRTSGHRLAALEGWAVDMDNADTRSDVPRTSKLPVRLVRGAD
ncbi:DUF1566 domain-containing protein [Simplicispira suum]|uniref:Lcl C-terminal domain-containing protein n=1 Tax=Simplicispira suum TaxID=2109915 RepID=A0A2S0N2W4_9BURK|nr:DUF1566 domain-containing protein [Simplicispira suum]AVO42263.1 hypothetical protein C6571_14035 [Simplicispira suum]